MSDDLTLENQHTEPVIIHSSEYLIKTESGGNMQPARLENLSLN